jgi:hypothetical protein
MRSVASLAAALFCCTLVLSFTDRAQGSLVMGSGLGTTHAGNLVANGSFETGAPPTGSAVYWATGTALTPYSAIPSWTSSGGPPAYAYWGSDPLPAPPQTINGSDTLPDGNAGLYFGNGAPAFVSQQPTFHPNGTVTFPSAPNFTINYSPVPVTLSQTINTPASPAAAYHFSFWVSGEGAVSGQNFSERGIFGLQVTNVLAGDPVQYLAVPNGSGNGFGTAHLYEFTFVPLVPSQPVKINFINYGHFDLSAYGMSNFTTELIMDDVIINPTPEPATWTLAVIGLCALLGPARRRSR